VSITGRADRLPIGKGAWLYDSSASRLLVADPASPWSRAMMAAALSLAALAQPGIALAYGYNLNVNVITEATFFPEGSRQVGNIDLSFDPRAFSLQALDREARVSNGGKAVGMFLGSVGLLEAYASAAYPLGGGGLATSTVTSSFADTIAVSGAGLALGTPVSYRLDFSIEGSVLTSPEGSLPSAFADAAVTLQDDNTYQAVTFNWSDKTKAPGVYSLVLNTQVGHSLVLYANLNVGAQVGSNSLTGRFAEADFYHSARYALAPSVAGLNTVGSSGHDFAVSSVPEPSSWVLLGAGLMALLLLLHGRRART